MSAPISSALKFEIAPTVQLRSRKKFDRMLESGLSLIEQKGFDRVRISDITKQAGCSVGTFYERFKDKGTFFNFLLASSVEAGSAGIKDLFAEERWRGVPTDLVLSKIIAQIAGWFDERKGLYCAALNMRFKNENDYRPFGQVSKVMSEALASFLASRKNELPSHNTDLAAAFAVQMINGALVLAALTEGSSDLSSDEASDSTILISDPEFAAQLSKAVCAYLGVPIASETRS